MPCSMSRVPNYAHARFLLSARATREMDLAVVCFITITLAYQQSYYFLSDIGRLIIINIHISETPRNPITMEFFFSLADD